jgi:hypothetical protein
MPGGHWTSLPLRPAAAHARGQPAGRSAGPRSVIATAVVAGCHHECQCRSWPWTATRQWHWTQPTAARWPPGPGPRLPAALAAAARRGRGNYGRPEHGMRSRLTKTALHERRLTAGSPPLVPGGISALDEI